MPAWRKVVQSIPASAESGTSLLYSLTRHPDQSWAICLLPRLVPELLRPARSTALLSQQPRQDRTEENADDTELRPLMDELSSWDCAHFTDPAGNSNPNPIYYSLGYCLKVRFFLYSLCALFFFIKTRKKKKKKMPCTPKNSEILPHKHKCVY